MRGVSAVVRRRVAGGLGVLVLALGGAGLASAGTASAESLVNLSGTVSLGGTPAWGARVSFAGVSSTVTATADQNGHYVLHPFSGDTGTLTIAISVVSGSVPLAIGTTDQVEDVTFPTAPATGTVNVVDGDTNPLANVAVKGTIASSSHTASGATSDGALLTWGFAPNPFLNPTQTVCTTNSAGVCSFPSLLHMTGTLQATVTAPYGNDTSYPSTFSTTATLTQETDPAETTLTVDWTHSLVNVSGTVTIGGSPAAGASVTFAGLSTTTDANGYYALHPFASTSGTLAVTLGGYSSTQPLTVGVDDQTVDIDIPSQGPTVQLSGVVTLGGFPWSGAIVSLGGLSTTTNGSGQYVLHPFPGTVGTIQVVINSLGIHAGAPITVGSGAQVDNVNIPTGPVTANVHVIDGDGNPIPSLQVFGTLVSSTSPVTGLTSDGSTVTWGVEYPNTPQPVCQTNASGTCSFGTLANLTGTVTATVNAPYGNDHSYPSTFSASITGSTATSPVDLTLTVDWVHTLVTLSGTVTIGGTPAPNATVTYGNLSTTTDASGHYAVHPFAGTSGNLEITSGLHHGSAPVTLGSTDQTADVDLPPGDFATLSGTVLVGDVPGAHTTVTFGGISTITDSSGHYSLEAVPGSSGPLSTNDGLIYSSAPITVTEMDQIEDVAIPTGPTTATIATADGSGNLLPGLNVHLAVATTPSPVTGTTTSGATITWGIQGPFGFPITRDCTTGANGTCSFEGLTNLVGTISASKPLVDGDPSYPTLHASLTGFALTESASVTLSFPNVAYVPSAGAVSGSVLVTTSGTSPIADPAATAVPPALLPPGTSAPVGAIGYKVHSVPVGGTLDVFVQLPPGTVPTSVAKLINGTLVDVSSIATIASNTITLHLTDGGLGDADGVANGTIVDPVVPLTGVLGTRAQTIKLSVGAKKYGAKPFLLHPTATSKLAVSVTSTTPSVCTVASNTVTVLATGTCTLSATQPGDGTFAAAPPISRSFTVLPKALSVTASGTRLYGGTDPSFTLKYGGFVNGDTAQTVLTGAPECASNASPSSGVGYHVVTCTAGTLAASNYAFSFKPGKLRVTQAFLTVRADNQSRVQGAANPPLTTTVTGFANGETLGTSDVTGAPLCKTTAKATSRPSTYKITCAKGTLLSVNYRFVFVAGTLTVT